MKRSKLTAKLVVFALIAYAGVSLISLQERIEEKEKERDELRRLVVELEVSNAEYEYQIENHDNPDVIAEIARSDLGLALPGEVVFYDGGASGTEK